MASKATFMMMIKCLVLVCGVLSTVQAKQDTFQLSHDDITSVKTMLGFMNTKMPAYMTKEIVVQANRNPQRQRREDLRPCAPTEIIERFLLLKNIMKDVDDKDPVSSICSDNLKYKIANFLDGLYDLNCDIVFQPLIETMQSMRIFAPEIGNLGDELAEKVPACVQKSVLMDPSVQCDSFDSESTCEGNNSQCLWFDRIPHDAIPVLKSAYENVVCSIDDSTKKYCLQLAMDADVNDNQVDDDQECDVGEFHDCANNVRCWDHAIESRTGGDEDLKRELAAIDMYFVACGMEPMTKDTCKGKGGGGTNSQYTTWNPSATGPAKGEKKSNGGSSLMYILVGAIIGGGVIGFIIFKLVRGNRDFQPAEMVDLENMDDDDEALLPYTDNRDNPRVGAEAFQRFDNNAVPAPVPVMTPQVPTIQQAPMYFCPHCQGQIQAGAEFCPSCGSRTN